MRRRSIRPLALVVLISVLIAACTQPSGGGAGASAPAPVDSAAPAPVETTDGYSY
jgi:hypothetical protein